MAALKDADIGTGDDVGASLRPSLPSSCAWSCSRGTCFLCDAAVE